MKTIRFLLFLALISSSGFVLLPLAYDSASFFIYQHTHEAIVRMHLRFIPSSQFNEQVKVAIDEDDIETANQIFEVGIEQNVVFDELLLHRLEAENSTWSTFSRNSKNVWAGATTGEVKSGAGLTGAIISDFSGISDFRDLLNELDSYPEYDSFAVGLSLLGIAATAMTVTSFASGGATAPAAVTTRVGVTTMKVVRTSGKLSKKLNKVLTGHTDNIINKKALNQLSNKIKEIDFKTTDTNQFDELSALAKKTINVKAVKPLTKAADDMRVINSNAGFVGLTRSLTVADNLNDISRLKKLSKVTKSKFAGVLKLAPMLAKPIYKTLRVLMEATAFLIGALVWLCIVLWYLLKFIKFIITGLIWLFNRSTRPKLPADTAKTSRTTIEVERL